jgi:deoxyribonuclease-4
MALLGAHVSAAGGAWRAFERAAELGCDAMQIFVKNANRWTAKPLAAKDVERFRAERAEQPMPVLAHASYLINLCSTSEATFEKSVAALTDELLRCTRLGVDGLVLHPGAHLGAGPDAGLETVAGALNGIFSAQPEIATRLLLENTAGQGTVLGSTPAELGAIFRTVDEPGRLGLCLDTCHAFAAGYDLRTEEGYESFLEAVEAGPGLANVAAWHLNDSEFEIGEHKDRHASIGDGHLGADAFARLVHDPRFEHTPLILETPLGDDDQGHARDLATLRSL